MSVVAWTSVHAQTASRGLKSTLRRGKGSVEFAAKPRCGERRTHSYREAVRSVSPGSRQRTLGHRAKTKVPRRGCIRTDATPAGYLPIGR